MVKLRDSRKKEWFYLENDLADREDLTIYEKVAYVILARFANENDKAFPSYNTLAQKMRCSKPKAIEAVKGLIEKGLLTKENRFKKGKKENDSNLYQLLSAKTKETVSIKPKDKKTTEYSKEFEEFWKLYPRKKEKMKAFKCWNTLLKAKVKAEDLMLAVKNYSTECKGQDEKFIKHAATFLGPNRPYEDYLKRGKANTDENINPTFKEIKISDSEREAYLKSIAESIR